MFLNAKQLGPRKDRMCGRARNGVAHLRSNRSSALDETTPSNLGSETRLDVDCLALALSKTASRSLLVASFRFQARGRISSSILGSSVSRNAAPCWE